MEKIYTIVGVFEDIGEPTRIKLVGSYRSLESAVKALDNHIRGIFGKIVPEDELDEFISSKYGADYSWFYDDDNGLITMFQIDRTTLND